METMWYEVAGPLRRFPAGEGIAVAETLVPDELDLQLIQALQIEGRASFSLLGEVLGVSAHTVARRYRRLHTLGGLRVVGRPAQRDRTRWMVRLRCAPDAAAAIAAALARRADTTFIGLVSGGTELVCVTEAADDDPDSLLLRRLPRTPEVVTVTAYRLLHTFYGGPDGWFAKIDALRPDQVLALRGPSADGAHGEPDEVDRVLLAELGRDGRAGYARLAAATALSEPSVRRPVARLRASGALYVDVQLDSGLIGYGTVALLWLTAAPSALEPAGVALAGHPEVAFAAATTGASNLVAALICPDDDALYRYLTGRVPALPGIVQVETAPVIRQVKQLATT
jgi:DNA-binding Lrp family transcriptional regulator